jgi:hypothetical protein
VDTQSVGDYLSDLRDEFGEIVRGHPLARLKGIEKVLYLVELRFFAQHPQLLSGPVSASRLAMGVAPRYLGADGLAGHAHNGEGVAHALRQGGMPAGITWFSKSKMSAATISSGTSDKNTR